MVTALLLTRVGIPGAFSSICGFVDWEAATGRYNPYRSSHWWTAQRKIVVAMVVRWITLLDDYKTVSAASLGRIFGPDAVHSCLSAGKVLKADEESKLEDFGLRSYEWSEPNWDSSRWLFLSPALFHWFESLGEVAEAHCAWRDNRRAIRRDPDGAAPVVAAASLSCLAT